MDEPRRKRGKTLVAAHMGTWGANIPGNTKAAFEAALRQGADIIELDVTKSADDKLFVFHPETEGRRLGLDIDIRSMTSAEIERLRFVNAHGNPTAHCITRLEDMLRFLDGRCLINIDKFIDNPAEIAKLVEQPHMQDQVIVKTPAVQPLFDLIADVAGHLPYMPVVYDADDCCDALNRRTDIRHFGAEAVFRSDDSMLASRSYIDKMHRFGKKVWVNSIRFSDATPLAGSRCDDLALTGAPDAVWGWMVDMGYDIIQTDWVLQLCLFLSQMEQQPEHTGCG